LLRHGPAALDVADGLLNCCECTTYLTANRPDPKVALLLATYATSRRLNGAGDEYSFFEVAADVAWLLANVIMAWMVEVGREDAGRCVVHVMSTCCPRDVHVMSTCCPRDVHVMST
jgi:hypothetical protein